MGFHALNIQVYHLTVLSIGIVTCQTKTLSIQVSFNLSSGCSPRCARLVTNFTLEIKRLTLVPLCIIYTIFIEQNIKGYQRTFKVF